MNKQQTIWYYPNPTRVGQTKVVLKLENDILSLTPESGSIPIFSKPIREIKSFSWDNNGTQIYLYAVDSKYHLEFSMRAILSGDNFNMGSFPRIPGRRRKVVQQSGVLEWKQVFINYGIRNRSSLLFNCIGGFAIVAFPVIFYLILK